MKELAIKSNEVDSSFDIISFFILGALMAFTSLSIDLYLPAMPMMKEELNGNIELTVTGFLVGFAIAQILWGPISDRYGRKLPLTLGMILFVIGSIGCALSNSITMIVVFRVVQAFGACVGPMLSRAMVRDMFDSRKAAEYLSTLMMLMALAPIAGPIIGGQILVYSSWHSIFWLLALVGAMMFASLKKLPETLPNERRNKTSIWNAFKKYGSLLTNKGYMSYTLCVTFFYVAAFAFITGSPAVYMTYYGIDKEPFGFIFSLNIIGVMGLSFVNRYLVRKYSLNSLLKVTTTISMLAGIVLFFTVKYEVGGILGVIIPVFFFFSMNGIIAANTTAAALDKVPEMAGAGAALLGSLQYGSGIVSTVLLAIFGSDDGSPVTMSWIIAIFGIATALTIFARDILYKSKLLKS